MQTSNRRLKSIDRFCKHLGEKVSPEFLASCIKKTKFCKGAPLLEDVVDFR